MAEQRKDLRHRMAEKHEAHLAEIFGGSKARGSGNQWANPMDGRQSRYDTAVAFAWDGKSTLNRSISVTRDMLDKAVEQAEAERPMVALRFYDDERLRGFEDWMAIREDDMLELLHWQHVAEALSKEMEPFVEAADVEALVDNVIGDMAEVAQEVMTAVEWMRGIVREAILLTAQRMIANVELVVRTA